MGRLRAGVCRVGITPALGLEPGAWRLRTGRATGTDEPLLAQALVLDDSARARGRRRRHRPPLDHARPGRRYPAPRPGADRHPARRGPAQRLSQPSAPVLLEADGVKALPAMGGYERYAAALPERIAGAVYSAHAARRPAAVGAGRGRPACR